MNIRQLLLIAAGVLIGTSGALADDLTPEAAKQKAATFLLQKKSASGRRNAKAATAADLQMKQVAVDAKNLYVFNLCHHGQRRQLRPCARLFRQWSS